MPILALSGIYNSSPDHWISRWQADDARIVKLNHSDWDNPIASVWVRELEGALYSYGADTVLVAHSLACLMVVHWAAQTRLKVKSALLVSVPDPKSAAFPVSATGFADLPMKPLPFHSTVVSSSNDPYGSADHMKRCASAWGSRFVNVGALGHINAASGLGAWPAGKVFLEECF